MTMPTRTQWAERPNTQEIPHADYMLRHSRRMHRLCRVIARVELPEAPVFPHDKPLVFAANHRSFLDIAAAMAVFGKLSLTCRMQVRADLFDKPVVGGWLHRIGCIPTSTAVREQAEDTAVETLGAGSTVAIMPEGRLVPPKDRPDGVGQARTGVSRIAERTGAHIVPVAIHGSDRIWPVGRPVPKLGLFRRRDLIIRLGAPMEFPHEDHQDNANHLMDTIAEMLREIERDLAAGTRT
ncbi:MAG: lysophospholipid acyltransferase family protein [Actinomycetota bacterium]